MRNKLIGGRYLILDRLGEGGMAAVYVARDEKLDRKVAVKLLHQHFAENPEIRNRFELEAKSISQMDHPNIVKVYDYSGPHSKLLWIVTEILKGQNLAAFAKSFDKNRLNPIIASFIARETCKALEHAHSREIIHRDIKPENIMILYNGLVKLMDFGIAKDLHSSSMTVTGTFMGSPSYMSPEQIRGRTIDHRCDLYSMGVLFYELATGQLPYSGNTTHDVVMKIMEAKYTPANEVNPEIPRDVAKIIHKAMARDPDRRFQSARALGREIDRYIQRLGFDESHVELERYAADRDHYETRMKTLFKGPKISDTKSRGERSTQMTKQGLKLPPAPAGPRPADQHARLTQRLRQTRPPKHGDPGLAATALLPRMNQNDSAATNRTNALRRRTGRFTREVMRIKVSGSANRGNDRGAVDSEWRQNRPQEGQKKRRALPRVPKRSRPAYWIGNQQTWHAAKVNISLQKFFSMALLMAIIYVVIDLGYYAYHNIEQYQIQESNNIKGKVEKIIRPAFKKTTKNKTITRANKRPPKKKSNKRKKSVPKKARVEKKSATANNLKYSHVSAKPRQKPARVAAVSPDRLNSANNSPDKSLPTTKTSSVPAVEPAAIKVVNSPPALIYLDGKFRCRIPCARRDLVVEPGRHSFVAIREGYAPFKKTVSVDQGAVEKITPIFQFREEFKLILNWVKEPISYRIRSAAGKLLKRGSLSAADQSIQLPAGDYQLELKQGSTKKSINIFNPGGGAKRFIANPFEEDF